MTHYIITNDKDNERYERDFANENQCRHWIINHLDLSKNWNFNKCDCLACNDIGIPF